MDYRLPTCISLKHLFYTYILSIVNYNYMLFSFNRRNIANEEGSSSTKLTSFETMIIPN